MKKDYGETIGYDPLWKGPIQVSRKKTDTEAFKIFFVLIGIWFIIGIYAFSSSPLSHRQKRETTAESGLDKARDALLNSKMRIFRYTTFAGKISLLYILIMRWFPKFLTYLIIGLIWLNIFGRIVGSLISLSENPGNDEDLKAVPIVFSVILVIFTILVVASRKKIAISCAIIQEAVETAMFFPSHFLISIVLFPCIILVSVYTMVIHLKLLENDEIISNSKNESNSISVLSAILHLYNFCAFLVVWNFMSGMKHMIMSSSFSFWFWTINKDYVPKNAVRHSVTTVTRYHLGSVAFGSMIITICEIFKTLLKILTRGRAGDDCSNETMKCCFSCCCSGLMSYIEYVSRNAYVMCAIHGTDFLTSAKDSFNLTMRNVGKVIVTTRVSSVLISVGMLVSFLIPAIVAYCYNEEADETKKFAVSGAILSFSLILSSALFTIVRSAIDTIFICVIEDYERNDGSVEKPYYMNAKLKNLMLKE